MQRPPIIDQLAERFQPSEVCAVLRPAGCDRRLYDCAAVWKPEITIRHLLDCELWLCQQGMYANIDFSGKLPRVVWVMPCHIQVSEVAK